MDDLELLDWHIYNLRLHLFSHTGTDYYINSSDMGKVDSLRSQVTEYVMSKGLFGEVVLNYNPTWHSECSLSGDSIAEADYIQAGLRLFWVHLLEGEEKERN